MGERISGRDRQPIVVLYAIGSFGPPMPLVFPPVFWFLLVDAKFQMRKPMMSANVANASMKTGCTA